MAFDLAPHVLDKAAANDPDALDTLARAASPHIERQLLRYPLNENERRDLVQRTLLQVVRRIGSFRAEASFSTWLFRVTANEALMWMRARRRHRARIEDGLDGERREATLEGGLPAQTQGPSTPYEAMETRERDTRLRTALDGLKSDYRDVIAAHYYEDLGLQEIAHQFALTESAVRSRLHRARSHLRKLLSEPAPLQQAA
jgi:RNA polymerase sigma-70 factor (ECF subfamily)